MAISAFPFENADTTETQFSRLFSELQESGVCDTAGGNGLRVATGTGSTVTIQAGAALLRGFMVESNAVETRNVTGPSTSTRVDRVVARLNPTGNVIDFHVKGGSPGTNTPPALDESITDTFEIPLATVSVAPSGVLTVTDERRFVGMRVVPHTNATLPAANKVRRGQLVFNVDTGAFVYSNGTAWVALRPSLVDQATKWGPGTGYGLIVQTSTPPVTANTVWIKPTA